MKQLSFVIALLLFIATSSVLGAGYYNTTFLSAGSQATPFTWTGKSGDGNFTTPANWWGGVAPTGTSDVIFNPKYCTTTCNVTINASISVKSITIKKSYTGTITQAATRTITVGTGGWIQEGGTFTGSSSGDAIDVNGKFQLRGGTFTSTSGVLKSFNDFTVTNSPVFNANGGTFTLASTGLSKTITAGSIVFNHFIIEGGPYEYIGISGTMRVAGNFYTGNNDNRSGLGGGGTIEVSGNVTFDNLGFYGDVLIKLVGTSSQVVTGNSNPNFPGMQIASTGGTVSFVNSMKFHHNFIYTSGTVTVSSPMITFYGGNNLTPGNILFNSVTFGNGSYAYMTLTGTMKVTQDLSFAFSDARSSIDGGSIEVSGNVTTNTTSFIGTTTLKLKGSGNQSITGTGNLPNLEIASTGGTVSFVNNLQVCGSFTLTSGTVDSGTSTITFFTIGATSTITSAGMEFKDVTFANSAYGNYDIIGTMKVNNLNFAPLDGRSGIGGPGTIEIKGNMTLNNISNVSTNISLTGTATQTFTMAGNFWSNVTINSSSSTLVLATPLNMNGSTQTLTVNSGSINMAGFDLSVKSLALNGNTLTKNGGILTVNGSVQGTGSLNGGTVNP